MTQDHRFVSKKAFSALIIIFIIAIIAASSGCTSEESSPTPSTALPSSTAPLTPSPSATATLTPTTPAAAVTTTPPPTTTPAPTTEPVVPATPQTILSVTGGNIFIMRAGTDNWVPAEVGTTLQPGDAIRSENDSHAEVTFFEGSTIELDGDTQISLSEIGISDTSSTTIHLAQYFGNTVSRVKKLTDSASSYEIETQAAVAVVRGSTLRLTVETDGTTIVTNEGGDIRVIAQGVEVIVPEGTHSSVTPGEAPGQPEPIETPPTPTPTPTPPPTPEPVYIASINTGVQADCSEAHIGETITYTYYIANTGNLQLLNVTVTDNVTGTLAFPGGDSNEDSRLDPGETWIYTATHIASAGDPSPLVNTARFSATVYGSTLVAEDHASVLILPSTLTVVITSPVDGATVNTRTIDVSGTVSDTSITEGTITINGESHAIAVSTGGFNTSENVNNGENTITVTVTDAQEQTASDTITIIVATTQYGIRVQLTWSTNGTDVDAHLIRPGGEFGDLVSDCFFANKNPDWGVLEVATDNASLDQDDQDGYGPENITLQEPSEEGFYRYKVHYFADNEHGPTTATVRIWIDDILVAQYSKSLVDEEVWDCAIIEWPSGNVSGAWPVIALTKTAAPPEVYVGDNITYTYHVSNTGNVPLAFIAVADNVTGVPLYQSGDTHNVGFLDVDEVWEYSANYTATAGQVGTLANTATAEGMYMFTEDEVTAQDSASVTVYAVLEIDMEGLPDGEVDTWYEQTLSATGGKVPYQWEIIDGSLPEGLELVGNTITGTPTTMGEFTFTVQVTDDLTGSATLELSITINPGGT